MQDAVGAVHLPASTRADTDREGSTHGIESRGTVMRCLTEALDLIHKHGVDRILTLGGECSVSVAPFAVLAEKYGDNLAVVWIDAHPDTDTPETGYDGYHAMAVSHLSSGRHRWTGSRPPHWADQCGWPCAGSPARLICPAVGSACGARRVPHEVVAR